MSVEDELQKIYGPNRVAHIAESLKQGRSVSPITVRTLLSWYGASRRGFWFVKDLRSALKRAGLKTVPDFEAVYLDGPISFELEQLPNPSSADLQTETADLTKATIVTATDSTSVMTASDPTIRLSRLAAANKSLISMKPDASLAEAVTQMLHYDFSQLPVMSSERDVKGVISWKSIGARLCTGGKADYVREAMDAAVEAPDDVSLFAAIPIVVKHDYLLVRAPDRTIAGILTSSDLGLQFQQLAEPFLLLGEIENYLRRVISSAGFTADELENACDRSDTTRTVTRVEDMSFGEYIRLLQNEVQWGKTKLKLDRTIFCKLLDEVREIRNDVMHFDPDGVDEEDLERLRRLTSMFQRLGSINSI